MFSYLVSAMTASPACICHVETLQKFLEKSLEKKAGRNYGPVANKTMIYFIDDLNVPAVKMFLI